ncbi:MAG TPA: cytochrome b [Candidatus Cybelea sp.]|nr:cytochrome b [Candidatus Cybelea sp.]
MNANVVDRIQGYDAGAKVFHWLTVALLLAQYAVGWIMPAVKRGTEPEGWINLHMSIGTTILAVAVLRLAWRLLRGAPDPPADLPRWQHVGAAAIHWLLYGLVIAMIFTGWSFASSRGWTIVVFGLVPMPALFAKGSTIGHDLGELHIAVSWTLLAVAAAHVLAALIHEFVLRDTILRRMLPDSSRERSAAS